MTNEEMIAKAKEAGSADELVALAKKNGRELSSQQANILFGKLHQSDSLSDDELENAVGGCKTNGHTTVTCDHKCHCGQWSDVRVNYDDIYTYHRTDNYGLRQVWYDSTFGASFGKPQNKCGTCRNLGFKSGIGYCEID